MEEIYVKPGPLLPIDPLNQQMMAVANRIYSSDRKSEVNHAINVQQNDVILNLIHDLRDGFVSLFDIDEGVTNQMLSLLGYLTENSHGVSWMSVGSGVLKALSGILALIPGLNIAWGLAAYGGGVLLDWYDRSQTTSMLSSLGATRYNVFDNLSSNFSDEMSVLGKFDESEKKIEYVNSWMNEQERRVYQCEQSILSSKSTVHGLQFWSDDDEDISPLSILLYVGQDVAKLYVKTVQSNGDCTGYADRDLGRVQNAIETKEIVRYQAYGNSKRVRKPKLMSSCDLYALEDVIVKRFFDLDLELKKVRLSGSDMRTYIILFLQLGGCT
jgi:hypothetical protein